MRIEGLRGRCFTETPRVTPVKHLLSLSGVINLSRRFPNIACELLTADVSIINDKLGGDESLLEMLYHFLEQIPPLNPLLASFFSKTIGNLIARKTEQVGWWQNDDKRIACPFIPERCID